MITLSDLHGRATITVPEAGQLLGIGRDAAYAAAKRGQIPVLPLGRRLVVSVPALLELLGAAPPERTEADPARSATATVHALTTSLESSHGAPPQSA